MRVLKITGIVLAVLIGMVILLGLVAPTTFHVERTVLIDAPGEVVFDQVKYWRNWNQWSPWAERDASMEVTVDGIDGEVGSSYNWVGNPELTGSGSMTNTGIKENEQITYHLHFKEPWESESEGYVRVSDEGEGTKAAWGFQGEYAFPLNVMMLFTSMEKMIGPDFDRGLERLKQISEQQAGDVLP